MNESFLWYLWKYRLYSHDLTTLEGESVTVEYPGQQNTDAGPDFFNAKIRIGPTLWAGNVEVHTKASDWHRHRHQHDKAFDSVILHVVYTADEVICRADGQPIPVVELKDFIDDDRWNSYRRLMKSSLHIPCSSQLHNVDELTVLQWLDRTLVTRMERKTQSVMSLLTLYNGDWEAAFYQQLAGNFGFKVNTVPFELLARSLPLKDLLRHKSNLLQMEALLFGQAGMLGATFSDRYPLRLKEEYIYLKAKLRLEGMGSQLWKFARMRPANFPSIRIAQFAQLYFKTPHLFPSIVETSDLTTVAELFKVGAGEYWNDHYVFDRQSALIAKMLGNAAFDNILINTIVPFLFAYGRSRGDAALSEKALQWLTDCDAENNSIIRAWKKTGISVSSASHSQALIELRNEYCAKKNCLTCGIGLKLLQQT